jgi:hypothetical protein
MAITRATKGERFRLTAADWNQVGQTVDAVQTRLGMGGTGPSAGYLQTGTVVFIHNNTGVALPRWAVVGLGAPIIPTTTSTDGFQERVGFHGETPNAVTHREKFAVLQEPCPIGEYVSARVTGVTICKVNMSEAGHAYATLANEQTGYLASAPSGPHRILHVAGTSGEQWAYVALGGGSDGFLAAVQTDITGSANVVSVKKCDANGVTSGDAFDVYLYSGQGYWDPTAVTVAGASATATCKLAAGKIIACAYSGADAYLLGDVAQIVYDVRYDTSSHKFQAQVYWRVGIAVSTVSAWLDVRACTQVTAITAWQVDDTSGEVQKKTQAFYAPEVGSESAWTKIEDTMESKPNECTTPGS